MRVNYNVFKHLTFFGGCTGSTGKFWGNSGFCWIGDGICGNGFPPASNEGPSGS